MRAAELGCLVCALSAAACGNDDPTRGTVIPDQDASLVDSGQGDALHDHMVPDGGLDAKEDAPAFTGPGLLSLTGLFVDMTTRELATGVMPFAPRYPVWHDGATSERFIALPPGAKIDTSYMDIWKFPVGTRAWKEFYKGGKLIETRYLEKKSEADGDLGWLMVSYLWDAAKKDGVAVPDGVKGALGTDHDIPDRETCTQCHNGAGDVIIGVSAIQSSKESGGGFLSTLASQGQLSAPPAGEFPMPGDGLVEDVLGYIHGNCAHCHNDVNWLSKLRTLRLHVLVDTKTPETSPTYQTCLNAKMNHVTLDTTICIVPGDPKTSHLYVRMGLRNWDAMPNFDTKEVDNEVMPKLETWIKSLPP